MTHLLEQRVVRCPFSVAHDYAEEFFKDAHAGMDMRVPLRDLIPGAGFHARHKVRLVFNRRPDEGDAGRAHDLLVLGWRAQSRLFPDFRGGLSLRIASVDETRLTLEGTYDPPFGPLGGIFDLLLGRRLARSTMRDLLRRLGAAMEAREEEYLRRERAGT